MYTNLSKIPNLNWKANWIWNNGINSSLLNDVLKKCFIIKKIQPHMLISIDIQSINKYKLFFQCWIQNIITMKLIA
jgi:hypothetical protein